MGVCADLAAFVIHLVGQLEPGRYYINPNEQIK